MTQDDDLSEALLKEELKRERRQAARSKGGKARVPKGFSAISPERRREISQKGHLARWGKGKPKG